jgi:hypothetical protein
MDCGTSKVRVPKPPAIAYSPPAYVDPPPSAPTTHRNVVIGVTILRLISLFSIFFWMGIWLSTVINPPELTLSQVRGGEITFWNDYLSGGRVFMAAVIGIAGTVSVWAIADSVIE